LLLYANKTVPPDTIGLLAEKSEAYMVHQPNKPAPTLTRHVILRHLRLCLFLLPTFLYRYWCGQVVSNFVVGFVVHAATLR